MLVNPKCQKTWNKYTHEFLRYSLTFLRDLFILKTDYLKIIKNLHKNNFNKNIFLMNWYWIHTYVISKCYSVSLFSQLVSKSCTDYFVSVSESFNRGKSDRALALYMANMNSIPITPYGPYSSPGMIPECRTRSKPKASLVGVFPTTI